MSGIVKDTTGLGDLIEMEGTVEFRIYSISGHHTRAASYAGQVDAFGVFCPATRTAYLVPFAALGSCGSVVRLRVHPARNGQTHGIRYASEFIIAPAAAAATP